MPSAIAICLLRREDLPAAVGVAARGMHDNPVNIQALGKDETYRRNRLSAMFAIALARLMHKGMLIGAYSNGALVGVLGMTRPKHCRTTKLEKR